MAWLGAVGAIAGAFAAIVAWLAYGRSGQQDSAALLARIVALETKVDVFWQAVQADMIKLLHHPYPERAELDRLLDRLQDKTITDGERTRLRELLTAIRDASPASPPPFRIDPAEQVAAVFLLHTMDVHRGSRE